MVNPPWEYKTNLQLLEAGEDPLWWLRPVDQDAWAILSNAYDVPSPDRPTTLPRLLQADPWSAAPRVRFSPRSKTIPSVSFISLSAWEHLAIHGWVGPETGMADPWLEPFYDWMRWRMTKYLPGYRGRYPMWVDTLTTASDLKWSARDWGQGTVVLTLDIPADRVLLSDADAWTGLLGGRLTYSGDCEICGSFNCRDFEHWSDLPHEPDAIEQYLENLDYWGDVTHRWRAAPQEVIRDITKNWDQVFDPRRWKSGNVQGTTEVIFAEWVKRAAHVVPNERARPPRR